MKEARELKQKEKKNWEEFIRWLADLIEEEEAKRCTTQGS